MTIEFTKFLAPAPVLEAILVTESNVEELAVWMGADTYSIEKTLVGGERIVIFKKTYPSAHAGGRDHPYPLAKVKIGHYLVRYPEHHDNYNREFDEKFFSVTQADITNFTKQQEAKGHIDPESRADDKE